MQPLLGAHPRAAGTGRAAGLRCGRDATRRATPGRRAGPGHDDPPVHQAAPAAGTRNGPRRRGGRGGTGGSLVRLLAGRRRVGRGRGGEEGVPREKTCGDGLTPRAVRQLADMGLEGALGDSHRYGGLRAFGFGQSIEMQWPEHPNFPNYGYTITRHDLDGLVAAARGRGRRDPAAGDRGHGPRRGRERPAGCTAHPHRGHGQAERGRPHPHPQGSLRGGGRRSELAGGPHARYVAPPRAAARHGPARLLPVGPPRRPLH